MLSSFKRTKMGQRMSNFSRSPRSNRDSGESSEKRGRTTENAQIEYPTRTECPIPYKMSLLLDTPPQKECDSFGWSTEDKSMNIIVIPECNGRICRRLPVAQSTDCIRGNQGFSTGIHMWEIEWEVKQRGTHAMIGVATADAPLHCPGYRSLIGSNKESWGWDLGRSKLLHDCVRLPPRTYPKFSNTSVAEDILCLTDCIKVVLDMDAGTLSFMADNIFLGVAFEGLSGRKLYPIISAVWGHCEVKIRYLSSFQSVAAFTLKELCRRVIKQSCRESIHFNNNNNNPLNVNSSSNKQPIFECSSSTFTGTQQDDPTQPSSSSNVGGVGRRRSNQSSFQSSSNCNNNDAQASSSSTSSALQKSLLEMKVETLPLPVTLKQYLLE